MIISKTPLRISFVGGGTDLPAFYKEVPGAVISTSFDRYVYIAVNKRFDSSIRASYSQTELVDTVDNLENDLFRETMREAGVTSGVEITAVADVPTGTGLGSSSSFAVGLLNALYGYRGRMQTAEHLARQACKIELDVLEKKIGKQDQYAASYGGLKKYEFNSDGSVFVNPLICSPERRKVFFSNLSMFYVGGYREASSVLQDTNLTPLKHLRRLVDDFWGILTGNSDIRQLGEVLDAGWTFKKQMGGVTNSTIDDYYAKARRVGALGGKLLGAGQTGFLLFFSEMKHQRAIERAVWPLRRIPFNFEPEGSKIIYVGS